MQFNDVVVLIWLVIALIGNRPARVRRDRDNMKGKKDSGSVKGLGVVTMATAFAVSAEPEVEFVSSGAKKRGSTSRCLMRINFRAVLSRKSILVRLEPAASSSDRNPCVSLAREHSGMPS